MAIASLSLCYGIVQAYCGRIDSTGMSGEDDPDVSSRTAFTVSPPLCA
jgi:hypothetical protein